MVDIISEIFLSSSVQPGFGDFALNFTVNCNVAEFVAQYQVQHELRKRILKRLRKEQIEIPFPSRAVYLRGEAGG